MKINKSISKNTPNTTEEPIFNYITLLASEICNTPVAYISLITENKVVYKNVVGTLIANEMDLGETICNSVISKNKITLIEDTLVSMEHQNITFNTSNPRFFAGIPLTTSEGHKLGTLSVLNTSTQQLNLCQIKALDTLAQMTTNQIELKLQAQKKSVVKKQHIGKIIHDIKNRNTTISLSTEIILAKINDHQTIKCFAEKIKNSTDKIMDSLHKIKESI